MLLNLTVDPKIGDTVTTKLVSGEEILAKLEAINGDEYTFSRIVVLQLVPTGNGQAQVSFAPFALGLDIDDKLTINYGRLLYRPVHPREDAEKQYVKSTTGIVV